MHNITDIMKKIFILLISIAFTASCINLNPKLGKWEQFVVKDKQVKKRERFVDTGKLNERSTYVYQKIVLQNLETLKDTTIFVSKNDTTSIGQVISLVVYE